MERLGYKYEKFIASLNALDRSIKVFSRQDIDNEIRENLVASLIKHYELCYESAWQFLKLLLQKKYNLEINSPKKVFRECFILGIINEKTTKDLLDIAESRNSTSHNYNNENAKETCSRIESYFVVFKIIEQIKIY